MAKFTKIPEESFKTMQLNAGIILRTFEPETGTVTNSAIMGATSGGIKFSAVPTFVDQGEDVDNCPKNMMELKKLDTWDIKMSGTFVSAAAQAIKEMIAAADIKTATTLSTITPRNDLKTEDFIDVWWVGDYSDDNTEESGGFVAIHMMRSLNSGGFQLQSGDNAKGQFPFEYTAHYSMDTQEVVPFEVYVMAKAAA